MSELTGATHPSIDRGARDEVEAALVFDRSATRLLVIAEAELSRANNERNACPEPREASDAWRAISRAIETATRAQLFAMTFQSRCRAAVAKALSDLGAIDGVESADLATEPNVERTDAAHPSIRRGAREEVEAALVFDRSAMRLLVVAEAQLSLARDELSACPQPREAPEAWRAFSRAIETATRAQVFAISFQARCRAAVADALAGLRAIDGVESSDLATESNIGVAALATRKL
jgi:hypothetical protein